MLRYLESLRIINQLARTQRESATASSNYVYSNTMLYLALANHFSTVRIIGKRGFRALTRWVLPIRSLLQRARTDVRHDSRAPPEECRHSSDGHVLSEDLCGTGPCLRRHSNLCMQQRARRRDKKASDLRPICNVVATRGLCFKLLECIPAYFRVRFLSTSPKLFYLRVLEYP